MKRHNEPRPANGRLAVKITAIATHYACLLIGEAWRAKRNQAEAEAAYRAGRAALEAAWCELHPTETRP